MATPPTTEDVILGGVPATFVRNESDGISAATRARNVGVVDPPLDGPENTTCADCAANTTAIVPLPITGFPLTENIPGIDRLMLVTVPLPGRSADTSDLKAGAAPPPDVGPARTVFADSGVHATDNVPDMYRGELDTENCVGMTSVILAIGFNCEVISTARVPCVELGVN